MKKTTISGLTSFQIKNPNVAFRIVHRIYIDIMTRAQVAQ